MHVAVAEELQLVPTSRGAITLIAAEPTDTPGLSMDTDTLNFLFLYHRHCTAAWSCLASNQCPMHI